MTKSSEKEKDNSSKELTVLQESRLFWKGHRGGGGGHFNFICTGVCGHRIGKLTHPQTKAGPSINKNRPIVRLFTIEID